MGIERPLHAVFPLVAQFEHALTRLSREHREIIDLVYYHEQSVDECATVLGIFAATVKTRMCYARKKLAEMVDSCR